MFIDTNCLHAHQLRDLIRLFPINDGYGTVELQIAQTVLSFLADLSAVIYRLRKALASVIPARIETEINRLDNISASASLSSEVVDMIEKRFNETGDQLKSELSASVVQTFVKADAALSAVKMVETETVQLRNRAHQLEALVAGTIPTGAVCRIEDLLDCQYNCLNILTFCNDHCSVTSRPIFREDKLKLLLANEGRSDIRSGWYSDP
jgi:hypothetical protein